MSGGKWESGSTRYRKVGMGMGAAGLLASNTSEVPGEESEVSLKEWGKWQTSEEAVRAVREIADEEWALYVGHIKDE